MKKNREELITKIFTFMPLFHKKFFKGMHMKKTMHKLQLLGVIRECNGKPMKYYGETLYISRPNLTKMINRLIEDGLVERKNDVEDRRVIKIYITEEGIMFMEEHRKIMKEKMVEKIIDLTDDDVDQLTYHFDEMSKILEKLNN